MRNERPFCPLLYKAICVGQLPPPPRGAGVWGLGRRQTQPHSPRLVNRQQLHSGRRQGSGWNLWPQGYSRGKEAVAGGLSPEVHSQVSVPDSLCFPSTSPLPRILKLEMRNPLYGVFVITMKPSPPKNSSHSRGGIYHPMPRLQTCPCFRSSCPERRPCQTHETSPSGHLDKEQPFG